MPPGGTADVLHHRFRRSLGARFCIGGFGSHLRSFVTTTKPKSSLIYNLKSVPWVLTADSLYSQGRCHDTRRALCQLFLRSQEFGLERRTESYQIGRASGRERVCTSV